MTTLREAAKAALWAFQCHVEMTWPTDRSTAAIAALRAALAQQDEPVQEQPEPSGYCTLEQLVVMQRTVPSPDKIAIYTAPPKADSAQEPVAWALHTGTRQGIKWNREVEHGTPLYTTPPQRQPLTQEEIDRICASLGFAAISPAEIVRAVERAHGIGERP